jgi:hypothetical protein
LGARFYNDAAPTALAAAKPVPGLGWQPNPELPAFIGGFSAEASVESVKSVVHFLWLRVAGPGFFAAIISSLTVVEWVQRGR